MGLAGKPFMLYFSRVEIDPERIDVSQIEKLKVFKEKAYPRGMIENYRSIIEFRDKFARQLELKVRDLQSGDAVDSIPLSLEFLSIETGEPIGNAIEQNVVRLEVSNLDTVPLEYVEKVRELVDAKIRDTSYMPIALAIRNASAAGFRNLFVELHFGSDNYDLKLTTTLPASLVRGIEIASSGLRSFYSEEASEVLQKVDKIISKFKDEALRRDNVNDGWRLSFEWDALQPQRIRLITPVLYVSTDKPAKLHVKARVYSDSAPEPFELNASVSLKPHDRSTDVQRLVPDWQRLIKFESYLVARDRRLREGLSPVELAALGSGSDPIPSA